MLYSGAGSQDSKYFYSWLTTRVNNYLFSNLWQYYAPHSFPNVNPNAVSATDWTTAPLQIDLSANDSASCGALGMRCNDSVNTGYYPTKFGKKIGMYSRTCWSCLGGT